MARASQVYGTTARPAAYGLLWSPAPPAPTPPTRLVADVVKVEQVTAQPQPVVISTPQPDTDVTADGGLTLLGRWLIRVWLRVTIRRT